MAAHAERPSRHRPSRTTARASTPRSSGCSSSSRRRSCSSARSSRPTSSSASSTASPWPTPPFHLPVFVARRQHRDPRDVELHDALGAAVDQARQPRRAAGRAAADVPDGPRLPADADRASTRASASLRTTARSATIFYCLTGLHGAHVFVGLSILLFMTIRAFRGHFSPEHHHGVEIGGIYWHFVDVMWIVVYSTVYISSEAVINPLRSEAEAFRFLLASIGYFGAIVIAALIGEVGRRRGLRPSHRRRLRVVAARARRRAAGADGAAAACGG